MPRVQPEQPPKIIDYLDCTAFIRAHLEYRKKKDPSFTLQGFAGEIASNLFRSGLMYAILKGKRKISASLRPKLARALQLKEKDAHYFDFLVQFNQSKDMDEKNHCFLVLSQFRNSKAKLLSEGQYKFFSQWYYPVVWNFFGIDQKQGSPAEIAHRISPAVTASQVSEAIRVLLELNLIKKTANGYNVAEMHMAADREIMHMVLRAYNRAFINMAAGMLDTVPPEERQYNTLITSLSAKGFAEIKERMRSFQQEIQDVVDRDKDMDRVYAFCMQLFPTLKAQ
jgi:uncharacterized protein (TIGR02147 family)